MKDNYIYVKEKRKDFLAKGFILLALMVLSLLCAFAPLLIKGIEIGKASFYLIGGLLFAVFASIFVYLLYKEYKPENMLILSSRGFVDRKNVGKNIEIEWTNVASVKTLGNKDMSYLGITLENCDIIIARMKKRDADEMRDNIDDGLPHILIAQNEIYTPVNELKDTFVRLVREARILNNEPKQKAKHNPFTTEDVLRAFGQLPSDDKKVVDDETTADSILNTNVLSNEINNTPANEVNNDTNTYTADTHFPDSFYEILKKNDNQSSQESVPNVIISENNGIASVNRDNEQNSVSESPMIDSDDSFKELSDEINIFLSRARFSKISELGKILNDNEVPFSVSKDTANNTDLETTNESFIDEPTAKSDVTNETENEVDHTHAAIDELQSFDVNLEPDDVTKDTVICSTPPQEALYIQDEQNDIVDFSVLFPDEIYEEPSKQNNNFDVTFETLIQQSKALDEQLDNVNVPNDIPTTTNMGDTKEFK